MSEESKRARKTARRVAGLVRHGHFPRPENVASAHLPLPLSELGREQASRAAAGILETCERLGLTLDRRIESSRLLRAHQTAQVLSESFSKRTGRPFEVEDRDELLERGMGSCANMRLDEIESMLALDPRLEPLPPGWRRRPDFRLPVPGAESLLEAGARTARRIEASLDAIDDDAPDRLRLFVAHSGCLRHAAVALGALGEDEVPGKSMEFVQMVCLERLADGRWVRVAGDWKTHVPEPGAPLANRVDVG